VAETRRLFFAIWPDEAAAKALHETAREAQRTCGGRLMRRDTLHLTLAFLGEVSRERVADAEAAAAAVAFEPFELTLDRLGYWRHNRIVWGGAELPALSVLAETLARQLRSAGFRLEARPFVAHMTLLRDAHCTEVPKLAAAVAWPVSQFMLVESLSDRTGARYAPVGAWPARPMVGPG
jgi:2'-5' RNA ligase